MNRDIAASDRIETRPAGDGVMTYAHALRRLARSPNTQQIARDLDGRYDLGLMAVFPIAWAMRWACQTVGSHLPKSVSVLVVENNDPIDKLDARWFGAVPILAGNDHKWSLTVVAAGGVDEHVGGTVVPAVFALKVPEFVPTWDAIIDRAAWRPDLVIFDKTDFRDVEMLRELFTPALAEWMEGGTRVFALGISQASVAVFAETIRALGGDTAEHIAARLGTGDERVKSPCIAAPAYLLEITTPPRSTAGFSEAAIALDAQMDIIAETLSAGDLDGFGPRFSQIGLASRDSEYSIALPFLTMCYQPVGKPYDSPPIIVETVRESLVERYLSGRPQQLNALDEDQAREFHNHCTTESTVAASLDRFRYAMRLYATLVNKELLTALSGYTLDDRGVPVRSSDTDQDPDDDAIRYAAAPKDRVASDTARVAHDTDTSLSLTPAVTDEHIVHATSEDAEPAVDATHDVAGVPSPSLAPGLVQPQAPASALVAEIRELQRKLREASALVETLRQENAALRRSDRVDVEADAIADGPADVVDDDRAVGLDVSLPEDWNSLFTWAHTTFGSAIEFTSKARRIARKSVHGDIPFIAKCIAVLAKEYRDVRMLGDAHSRREYDQRLRELGVTVGPTGAALENRRTADLYTATWERKCYSLDSHLQGSNSRDKRVGLRIYFAWLPEQCTVLIGHLPTHLPNSLS